MSQSESSCFRSEKVLISVVTLISVVVTPVDTVGDRDDWFHVVLCPV